MLTQEYLKECFDYDTDTGMFLKKIYFDSRGRKRGGKIPGTLGNTGYIIIMINYKRYLAHRLAWFYIYGYWPKYQIDHINGIKTDNRLCNLREANSSENQQNRKKSQKNNKSTGLIGSYLEKKTGKFYSNIQIDGKLKRIGYFSSPEEAHEAYLKEKREIHPFGTL